MHSSAVSAKQPGLANSCGRPGALQPRPVSCSEEGRPSQQWPGSQRGLGASFVVLTSRTAGLAQGCLGFKDLSYILFFFFESLWMFWNYSKEEAEIMSTSTLPWAVRVS